jgi:hypothetical protein
VTENDAHLNRSDPLRVAPRTGQAVMKPALNYDAQPRFSYKFSGW